jgi:hypothetical protein
MKKIVIATLSDRNTVVSTAKLLVITSLLLFKSTLAASDITTMDAHENDVVKKDIQKRTIEQTAIEGYDPVAYFTELRAVKGSDEISHEWLGDKWLFSSEKNKKLFVMDTMAYMPNYGGYCSFDPVSAGHDHNVDPTVWRILNDKLYLYYSEQTAGQKMHADEWKKVKAGLAQQ